MHCYLVKSSLHWSLGVLGLSIVSTIDWLRDPEQIT